MSNFGDTCCDAAMHDAALIWWGSGGVAVETSIAWLLRRGTGVGLGTALAASGRARDSVFIQKKEARR
eukprot:gene4913-21131_t